MGTERARKHRNLAALSAATFMIIVWAGGAGATEFERYLAHVDRALQENPNHAPNQALYSCQDRRARAVRLNGRGYETRATRSLKYCFSLLGLSEADVDRPPDPKLEENQRAATIEARRANAMHEDESASALTPNLRNGLEIYRECAACHMPEGWGMPSGIVPQLAGQHRSVIIKQLADIRAGYRKNRVMEPYASLESIGGVQAVADVAAYIDTLEMSVQNGRGPGEHLALGERLYRENCVQCHGDRGQGDPETRVPRIQAQHFGYLVTQFELIRDGERKNANPEMVEQIKGFNENQIAAVMDYVSRLEPPEELQATPDWRNPDFMLPRARP